MIWTISQTKTSRNGCKRALHRMCTKLITRSISAVPSSSWATIQSTFLCQGHMRGEGKRSWISGRTLSTIGHQGFQDRQNIRGRLYSTTLKVNIERRFRKKDHLVCHPIALEMSSTLLTSCHSLKESSIHSED